MHNSYDYLKCSCFLILTLYFATLLPNGSLASQNIQPITEINLKPYPFHHFVTLGAIRAYQILISPSKGDICHMHPHCSLYGYQAFKQYNSFRAFLMTADRLYRCGHDLDNYETIDVDGSVRFFDPVYPSPAQDEFCSNADAWAERPNQVSLDKSSDKELNSILNQQYEIILITTNSKAI